MKRSFSLFGVLLAVTLQCPMALYAAYQVNDGFCSSVGGIWEKSGGTMLVTTSNMQPYGKLIRQDLDVLNAKAAPYLAEGSANLNAMSLYNCEGDPSCDGDLRLAALLTDKNQNYLTAGFTSEYNEALAALRKAIKIYAFLYTQDPNYPGALGNLKQAFNDLMSTHMVFSDEFLVDALHLRFSNMSWTMDNCLAGQIALLQNAITYYKAGIEDFLSLGTEPIPGSPDVIAEALGADEWHLFGLLTERLSLAIRERGAKMRAMGQQTYDDAFIKEELSKSVAEMYVQTSVLAAKMGSEAFENSAQFLLTAIAQLGKQVDDHKRGLTPLGYDDLYVPLMEFEDASQDGLYKKASDLASKCATAEQAIVDDHRLFDQQYSSYQEKLYLLDYDFMQRLNSLTGCRTTLPEAQFIECVLSAGDILFLDCPVSLGVQEFNNRMAEFGSLGYLGEKYRQIKGADIALIQARLQHDNIAKQIENHNASVNYQIQIKKDQNAQQMEALSVYQEKLKNACTINDIYTTEKIRVDGKWEEGNELKSTVKSFSVEHSELIADLARERDVSAATLNFDIHYAQDPYVIKNLLLNQAEALVGIDAAVHNKNCMIATFHSTVKEKETLLELWRWNKAAMIKYQSNGFALHRILMSDDVIEHSRKLNELAHYTYLAAKALEYRYAKKLNGISAGIPNINDLYKCQSAQDFRVFLDDLYAYDGWWCDEHAYFVMDRFYLHLGSHILGIPEGEERFTKFQEFVNQHIDSSGNLTFSFITKIKAFPLNNGMDNIKIWDGNVPCRSGAAPLANGLTASLYFKGNPGNIKPKMVIIQKGNQTLLKDDNVFECFPVHTYSLLWGDEQEPLSTKQEFRPFIGEDLSIPGSVGSDGTWAEMFSNRSAAAQEWIITILRKPNDPTRPDIPFNKLEDIRFYFDGIGEY